MRPVDVKQETVKLIEKLIDVEINRKRPKFKVDDHVFSKGYKPYLSKEVLVIKKVKTAAQWTYVIEDLNCEELAWNFYEESPKKTKQENFKMW